MELDLLQKYIFIPLDIFAQIYHNKGIRNQREAWLAFLSQNDPEDAKREAEDAKHKEVSIKNSVLHAIREGQISFSHGVEILNLPDEESLKRLLAETEG